MDDFSRRWEGKDWEHFSLRLVQQRHGAANVQIVPDRVRGDAGLECFTLDGCCYQSYAPQEASDTAKAASSMKLKAYRDLRKLKKNEDIIEAVLNGVVIRRWILLCPFLDDKNVVSYVGQKAKEVYGLGISFLHNEFHGLVHCPKDFQTEIAALRLANVGATIHAVDPTAADVTSALNSLSNRLDEKLVRGFPNVSPERRGEQKLAFIKAALRSENLLNQMRLEMPELWDRAMRAILLEEERLVSSVSAEGHAATHLDTERTALKSVLGQALPSIEPTSLAAIAYGQIGQWLIECPLDFESI